MTSLFHKFLSTTLNSTLSPQSTSPDHISSSQAPDPASPSNNLGSTTSSTSTTASPGPKAPVTFSTGEGSGLGSGEGSGSMRFPSNEGSGLGSGEKSGSEMGITTVSTTTKEYPALMNDPFADVNKATAPRMFVESDKSDDESGSVSVSTKMTKMIEMLRPSKDDVQEPQIGETSNGEIQNKGHSTPGWIIIVGFIVGVAALIMLFVAIATRDKWNGPSNASQLETKTNSSNQQRELEMETFLHTEKPKENGKAAEYTVIPLDELPENYSSH
ncbi:uncharacterized protein LOC121946241 [Plectropomus leopardus]|uniref:uncharacterized protein LOC121946241 n=1 Tax=Plectropomus leopardus TaxID=160734 RepID=UPI001C4CC02A|nr:uncharacterized protein LOC121946241 [Plectropomus leopardus]